MLARRLPSATWVRPLSAVRRAAVRPLCATPATAPATPDRLPIASAEQLKDLTSSMSIPELADAILQRKEAPPEEWFDQLARGVQAADQVPLVLAAHDKYVSWRRYIGFRHTDGLMRACIFQGAWEELEQTLGNAKKLQLAFAQPGILNLALKRMADAGELDRVASVHALLPSMPLATVATGVLHYSAVKALAAGGALGPAKQALETAVAMAAIGGEKHAVWLATFTCLAEAQVEAGDYAGAAASVRMARETLAARGYAVWIPPAKYDPATAHNPKHPKTIRMKKRIAFVEKMRALKQEKKAAEGGAVRARPELDATLTMGELLAVAVRASVPPPPPPVGDADGEGEDAAASEEAAAASDEGASEAESEAAAAVYDGAAAAEDVADLAAHATPEAKAVAIARLEELGVAVPSSLA